MFLKKINNDKIKGLSLYLVASLVTMFIGVLINPFLSIGLDPSDFAILGYYSSFGTILTPLISFSFGQYYARNYFLVKDSDRNKILQTLLSLFLVFGLVMFFVFFIAYYFYHKKYVTSISFYPYAILSFLPFYFSSFYNIYLLDLRMKNNSKKYAIVSVLNSLLAAFLSILLVYVLNFGALGRLIALLVVTIVFGYYSFKMNKFQLFIDKKITKEALSFCWPMTMSAFLSFFFIGIDRTFLVELNDNYTLGLYNVALQISGYLAIFGTVILQTFEPDLYKYTSLKDHKKVFFLASLIIGLSFIPNLFFILLSEPLIRLLTYGRYVNSVGLANILSLKNVGTNFAFVSSIILIGYGYPRFELINRLLGSFFAFFIYKYFIENWGYYGAAWGQTVVWIVMGLITLISMVFLKSRIDKEV